MRHIIMTLATACACLVYTMPAVASSANATPPGHAEEETRGRAALQMARRMREVGEAGFGDQYRLAAATLAREGTPGVAVQAIDELLTQPETDLDRFAGLRMKAQYLLADGLADEAWVVVSNVLDLADSTSEFKRFDASYLSAIYVAAHCRRIAGDRVGELAVIERIAVTDRDRFNQDVVASAIVRRASLLEQTGDQLGAVEAIRALLEEYPSWGVTDGRRLDTEFSQLKRRFPNGGSELAAGLSVLWANLEYRRHDGILDVGSELRRALATASDADGAVRTSRELLDVIDANRARWMAESENELQAEQRIQQLELEELEYLAWSAPIGLQTHSAWAIGRLIERETRLERRQALLMRLFELLGSP